MKHKTLLTLFHLTVALGAAQLARAQTAFTYQGKLVDDCCPATGLYDLKFRLFDAATAGNRIPTGAFEFTANAVPVTNGLFTVPLDFGSTGFDGSRRWLELDVRTNNSPAGYATLSPRTELTATPYAIRALSASMMPSNSITAPNISAGQVVKSLNGLKDNINLVAGTNVTLTPSGNNLQISSSGGGAFSLNGSSAYYNGGNVGIGTSSPLTPLDIRSPDAEGQGIRISRPRKGTEIRLHIADNDYGFFDLGGGTTIRGGTGNGVGSSFGGTVGIGTTTPGGNLALAGNGLDGSTYQQFAIYADTSNGAYFDAPHDSAGNRLDYTFGWRGGDIAMRIKGANGSVGIGTTSPKGTLHVNGDYYGLGHMYLHAYEGDGNSGTAYVQARDKSGTSSLDLQFRTQRNGVIVDALRLGSDGNTTVKYLTITGGADLAEPFQMSEEMIPEGSVVVIDEENPGHLKQATSAYDTRVAGIVSGANGVKAGIALHQEGVLEGGQNVALTGRVFVKADASVGAIKPGDLLTTSDTPGHAMRVIDATKAQGAILGKAMTALKDGKGMVLVLVSLQ